MQQITRLVGLHLPLRIKDFSHLYIPWFFRQVANVDSSSRQEAVRSPLKKWSKMGVGCEYFRIFLIMYDHLMIWFYDPFFPIFLQKWCLQSLWGGFCLATTLISSFCRSSSLPGSNTKKPPRSWRVKLQATFASQLHVWYDEMFCTIPTDSTCHTKAMPGLDVIPLAVSPEAIFSTEMLFLFWMLKLPVTLFCRFFWIKNLCKVFLPDFAMIPK